jgi:hypothetical protein
MRPGQPWQEIRGSLGPIPLLMAQNHSFPIKLFPNGALSLQNNYKHLSMSIMQIKCRAFCIQVNQAKSRLVKASRVIFYDPNNCRRAANSRLPAAAQSRFWQGRRAEATSDGSAGRLPSQFADLRPRRCHYFFWHGQAGQITRRCLVNSITARATEE